MMEQVSFHDKEYNLEGNNSESIKTLYLRWNPREDNLNFFFFTISLGSNKITKCNVLAEIAGMFDPLGLLGPVIVQAKIFLQKLWLLKIEYDQEFPPKERKMWERFRGVLPKHKNLKIPHYIFTD
ncbi:integrase catalytic domain-containing protein [Nephila pilipes]|uniref:Integrase catalytic domain-containing protein n=1 Tax=Nephila pilipes TaxID=299642 RepID=A0A8X6QQD2_NEPPI|nr:integrase catalytic domain-containing protein [Nephila pilipes]